MTAFATAMADGWVLTRRNLIKIKRAPSLLLFTLVQPIMFVLLFAYVFGGSIAVPGVDYRDYLMAGIFVQTVTFASALTGVGLADDLQKGIVDRFRSLPMSRAAVLLGRTTGDLLNNVVTVAVMACCGLVVGWRIHTGVVQAVAGFALIFLFTYAMSWISATVGLTVRRVEVVQSAGFLWMFPLTFVSSVFVAGNTLPGPLRAFADWNPISILALALRDLWGNAPVGAARGGGFAAEHPVSLSVLLNVVILLVFMPLAVRQYRRAVGR